MYYLTKIYNGSSKLSDIRTFFKAPHFEIRRRSKFCCILSLIKSYLRQLILRFVGTFAICMRMKLFMRMLVKQLMRTGSRLWNFVLVKALTRTCAWRGARARTLYTNLPPGSPPWLTK